MTWLVIGIGNTLRRDDGLGPWLAERVADWRMPGVSTRIVHQLTPELADEIANYDRVLFIDASEAADQSLDLVEVEPSTGANRLGHALSPGDLLALNVSLASRRPRAWIVPVPGRDFDFGEGLSAAAVEAGETALAEIGNLLREALPCTKSDS